MPVKAGSKKVKVAPAPYSVKSQPAQTEKKVVKAKHPLIEARRKHFGIGQSIRPKRDLTRYVKWPKYVKIQRQEKILKQRLTAPPALHQFNVALDEKTSHAVFRFIKHYRPENYKEKKLRLRKLAQAKLDAEKAGQKFQPSTEKPYCVKFGLNHVTSLIEQKKARLVLIARDVEPIEMVVWMPALCRKMGVPYCIVKSKAMLGTFVHQKTATCLAFTRIRPEHTTRFGLILKSVDSGYVPRIDSARKKWSTPLLGAKTRRLLQLRNSESAQIAAST
ncbi:60S ribosomal protein L8 [Thelohanellus kitauei]|uniref:60S ribosomal protein L7a n=1 Tax=Thelohanellus kitauei TaxID=669202 RepID=A0A0C2N6R6_THEKT|nr:60S ribosomal protein L8 [Thelohanellus kitauei]